MSANNHDAESTALYRAVVWGIAAVLIVLILSSVLTVSISVSIQQEDPAQAQDVREMNAWVKSLEEETK